MLKQESNTKRAKVSTKVRPIRRKSDLIDKNFIGLTEKVFAVLESFSRNPRGPISLEEITQSVSLAKTTVHRLLYSMKKIGYLDQREDGNYFLSKKFYALSASTLPYQHLTNLARPVFSRLLARFGESVHIAVLDNGLVVFVAVAESQHAHRCAAEVGDFNYAHSTALGKCILAHLQPEDLETVIAQRGLPRLTPATIVDRDRLMLELEKIRRQGFAINHGETTEGVTCVSAPIFDGDGKVIAALSVSGPSFRMQSNLDALRRGVQHETARLSMLLGHRVQIPDDAMLMD